MTTIADKLQSVRARIAQACAAAGRAPDSVALLAVSKTFGADAVHAAALAGQCCFGENYIQEAVEKIAQVAARKQVLCITHLPQIASMADCHIYIEKKLIEDRTQTFVQKLSAEERLAELARMIGGEPISRAGLDNAAEMVRTAAEIKIALSRP